MSESLLLRNGLCLIPDSKSSFSVSEQEVDLLIEAGRITKIGRNLHTQAEEIINLKGLHILPGVIDSQVHFREPGLTHKEDIGTGSRGALLGGVTGFFEMPNTMPPTTNQSELQKKLDSAANTSWTNYAFFIGGTADNAEQLADLEMLPHCAGIKVFVGSSTGTLLVEDDPNIERIMRSGHRRVIFHSEDEFILKARRAIALDSKDVRQHPVWRSVESAVSSTQRLLNLARKTKRKIHILHVTSADEMALLRKAKDISTVEVLPQHLTLFAPDCYDRLGTLAQQNPPIRDKSHQEALWRAIADGTVDIVGSDHAPHTLEEKSREYPNSPSGMPSVQTLLPIMLNHVNEGRLSLGRLVQLMCEAPAKVFGLTDAGRIEVGARADLTIIDLNLKKKIENSWIASRSGWTPFDGMTTQGWPRHVILGGRVALREGEITSTNPGATRALEFKL